MSNPTYKPSEGKREEFRRYLERNGVMDALTKVLVNLYEEVDKPEDALEYIRDKLAVQAGLETLSQMKGKVDELQVRIDELQEEVNALKTPAELPAFEGDEENLAEALPTGDLPPEDTPVDPPADDAPPAE